jgi:ABC-type iron transport system FetAB permease component
MREQLAGTGDASGLPRKKGRGRSRLREIRDLASYVAIALVVVAMTWVVSTRTSIDGKTFGKWFGLAVTMAIVYVDTIRLNRTHWKKARFWLPLAGCLVSQSVAGILVLERLATVPAMLWAFAMPANYIVVALCVGAFERRPN